MRTNQPNPQEPDYGVKYTMTGDIIVFVQLDKNNRPMFATTDESKCRTPYAVDYIDWKRKYQDA